MEIELTIQISFQYIGDMYRATDDDSDEPEWVKHERDTFKTFRDKDSDGFLNNDEVKDWIIPQDFDHAEAEAKHLIYEADADSDEKLTKEEILLKYDVFVGSQATDFGMQLLFLICYSCSVLQFAISHSR